MHRRTTRFALLMGLIRGRLTRRGRRPGLRLVTSALVVAGFVGAAIALISATAAKPAPITATAGGADRAAAAARADRPPANPANPADPADAASPVPTADTGPALQAQPARVLDWVSPMPGTRLSSCYGARWGSVHQGIDFAAPSGTPIHAAGKGVVFGAGWLYAGYGISVVIDHGNGIFTHYAHLSQAFVVEGQPVNVSDIIGLEGSTGDSTGPHLHFEIHQGLWNQIDPAPWLRVHGVPSAC